MNAPAATRKRDDAALAVCLLAVDPQGLGGASIRGGAADQDFLAALRTLTPTPQRRLPLHISESRLLGGLDLAGTLQAGRPVFERGLLAEADRGFVVVPMAERMTGKLAAHLAAALDAKNVLVERDGFAARNPAAFAVVAFDESTEDEAGPPAALLDRLAFHIDMRSRNARDAIHLPFSAADVAGAQKATSAVAVPEAIFKSLCNAAAVLGIASLRAPMLAVAAARAHAALMQRDTVTDEDAALAAGLVLAARATVIPVPEDEQAEPPPPEPSEQQNEDRDTEESDRNNI
jgi:magnesium chelatase subunit D